ncbi:hypothetical protein MMC20_007034 [Loxospora ochrophaea]|nr:hypothetical protein [Loxospora ochrophaea]
MHRLRLHARLRICAHSSQLHPPRQLLSVWPSAVKFSTYQPHREDHDEKDDDDENAPQIRYYEQSTYGSSDRRRIYPEEEEKELKAKIAQLERELEDERRGSTMIDPLLEHLSPEDQEKFKQALREHGLDPEAEDASVEELSEQLAHRRNNIEVKMDLPPEQDVYLRRLNKSLLEVLANDVDPDPKAEIELWKWYARCKHSLPYVFSEIPDEAWRVLWESQLRIEQSAADKASHLSALVEDMIAGGRQLGLAEKLVFIKSLLEADRINQASEEWEDAQGMLKTAEESREFNELGVGIQASRGDAQRAQDLALESLADSHRKAKILTPVIEAWTRLGTDENIKRAWATYLRLRTELGSGITLEDYDEITMALMNAGRTDLALAVFKDMMLTGQASRFDSKELYSTCCALVGNLQSQSPSMPELTRVSLTALTVLPRRFQNKYFYASWMKRLIGMGEINAAASVIELMYERGVRPDAKHLNGIVGAWLRTKSTNSKKKAEQMAWAMIFQRLDFVRKRRASIMDLSTHHKDQGDVKVSDPAQDKAQMNPTFPVPAHLQRTVAPATIETFALLLRYYEHANMHKHVQQLKGYLLAAEIQPNTYFMNHLLYAELRRGNQGAAWETYSKNSHVVKPDLETFACLWDCEKAHLNALAARRPPDFPNPRRLFCDMLTWISTTDDRARSAAQSDFSKDMYDQIILCLCLARDIEGTLVALYALRDVFHMYPDQNTARIVVLQVSRAGSDEMKRPRTRRSRLSGSRLSDHPNIKENIRQVTRLLELVAVQRTEKLHEHGIEAEHFSATRQAEEQLFLLAELLRNVIKWRKGEDAIAKSVMEKDIQETARQMGVSGILMTDPLSQ